MDFLQTLQFAGFTARIKRLSERLMADAKVVYKQSTFDIEPNWHLVFLLLKQEEALSVTEIADHLGFSHPAIIKITKKMMEKGYLNSTPHPTDSRKKLLRLSEQSWAVLPQFEAKWDNIARMIESFVDQKFLDQLTEIESSLQDKRLIERLNEN